MMTVGDPLNESHPVAFARPGVSLTGGSAGDGWDSYVHDDDSSPQEEGWFTEGTTKSPRIRDVAASRKIFNSALMQRLVIQRMKRVGHVDPDVQITCPGAAATRRWLVDHAVLKRRRIPAKKVHQMLLAHGAYRPQNREIFATVEGESPVPDLCFNVLRDPIFVLEPKGHVRSNFLTDKDGLCYRRIIDAIHILDDW